MFTLSFDTGNAAFADGNGASEAAAILRRVAKRVESGAEGGVLIDSNGNTVGRWAVEYTADEGDDA